MICLVFFFGRGCLFCGVFLLGEGLHLFILQSVELDDQSVSLVSFQLA